MQADLQELKAKLAAYLDGPRVEHSLHVMRAAEGLAMRYCPGLLKKCSIAGLLHDNAKQLGGDELKSIVVARGHELSDSERLMPFLLHGKAGAILLGERFEIEDAEIADAIADHVTGRPGMGLLSKVVFVADQVAQDRRQGGVEELRAAARVDLDKAVFLVARYKLMYIIGISRFVDLNTLGVYNEYLLERGRH